MKPTTPAVTDGKNVNHFLARLVTGLCQCEHITPALGAFGWPWCALSGMWLSGVTQQTCTALYTSRLPQRRYGLCFTHVASPPRARLCWSRPVSAGGRTAAALLKSHVPCPEMCCCRVWWVLRPSCNHIIYRDDLRKRRMPRSPT